ncbi:hypothetical protein BDN70DRAFT_352107 [Pholiota conissans]|uniref:Uncharacterized protein n=1 Tax=Pholiota conissans TaxID=109636 RepID=A0A9P5YQA0_9AGAR|nr:hypothetical protein BDN70DRAFT_352107 [Pholiota conissans]
MHDLGSTTAISSHHITSRPSGVSNSYRCVPSNETRHYPLPKAESAIDEKLVSLHNRTCILQLHHQPTHPIQFPYPTSRRSLPLPRLQNSRPTHIITHTNNAHTQEKLKKTDVECHCGVSGWSEGLFPNPCVSRIDGSVLYTILTNVRSESIPHIPPSSSPIH